MFIRKLCHLSQAKTILHRSFLPTYTRNHLNNVQSMSTYRAAILTEFGQQLQIIEQKRTKLKGNQVRVSVHNCGVNASDLLMFENKYDHPVKLPFTPGCEICGEVIEIGPDVKTLTQGIRVLGLNKIALGGFAEECVLQEQDIWPVDHAVSFEKGASLADNYGTALLGLHHRADVTADMTVLVTAAAGGLGLAAVDVAANVYKAKVIGVCGTEDKADLVRQKGAWAALKYNQQHIENKVKEVTNGKGVDVIFDAVGGEVFTNCLPHVTYGGTAIVAGFASRVIPHIETSQLLPMSLGVIGVSLSHCRQYNNELYRQIIEDTVDLHEMGLISPHISASFTLDEAMAAFDYIRERKSTGKVVLEIK